VEAPRGAKQRGHGEPALAVAVIGMSAGGLYGLKAIMQALPVELPGAVVIACHVAAPSILPELISRWTSHVPRFAAPGDTLQSGAIYVAPAEHHIVINPDATLGVLRRERVRFVRPSIDWLFESAAGSFGERVVAVILSGANGDGSYGARCISRAGGKVIVQEPDSCEYPAMPSSVIATGIPHRTLHPCEIGPVLVRELSRMDRESLRGWYPFDDELFEEISTAPP
jgi:two-component system, chemotaxis family, protein-glutamate methylesterase/glutaminase